MKFYYPENIESAVRLKNENSGLVYLAGGTCLNSRREASAPVQGYICLNKLGLDEISSKRLGPMLTLQEVIDAETVHAGLRTAAAHVVNRNIRNMATIGGNIAAGRPSSDIIPAAIALQSSLEIDMKKNISISEWLKKPEGLITALITGSEGRLLFQKRYSRTKNDISLLKLCIGYRLEGRIIKDVAASAGCVGADVAVLTKTAELIEGSEVGHLDKAAIASAALAETDPISDLRASREYRQDLMAAAIAEFVEQWK